MQFETLIVIFEIYFYIKWSWTHKTHSLIVLCNKMQIIIRSISGIALILCVKVEILAQNVEISRWDEANRTGISSGGTGSGTGSRVCSICSISGGGSS